MSSRLQRFILENHVYHTVSATHARHPVFADLASARIVVDAVEALRPYKAFVLAFAVMPDHLHAILVPKTPWTISDVMRSLKGASAREVNLLLGTRGPLWQRSFYDRVIRTEAELGDAVRYVEDNPVTAGLIGRSDAYGFSSAHPGFKSDIDAWMQG